MMRNSIVHLIIALALLLVSIGAYTTWYVVVEKASARSNQLAVQIAAQSQAASRLAAAKDTLSSLVADEQSVEGRFVSTLDVVSFLEGLQTTGTNFGTNVSIVSVSADQKSVPQHLLVSLTIEGPFSAVMQTLGTIEYGSYDTRLVSLAFSRSGLDASKGTATWNASATFSVGMESRASTTPAVSHPATTPATTTATSSTP